MTLSDETHERIDAIHRESAQRALAAEIIAITVLQRTVDDATKNLVFAVATTNQKLKIAGPQLVRQASDQLQQAATAQATFALGHARNLALMQVHREAAEAAAIIKQLTGADVDLSVLKRIMLSPELDATRAATAARSIAGRFGQLANSEVALAGLRGTSASDLAKKLAAMGRSAPITTAIEGNATTISFTSYGGAHAQAWKDLADDGTGDEELLPHGWASGMMKVWSAVLDRKTCQVCFGLDGTMVPVDKPFPQHVHPPAHIRCRCIECSLFVPEKLAKKLPGIGIDYGQLKEDIRDYMRGSSINIGEGKRHAQDYIKEALRGTSPETLTRRLIERDYFTKPPKLTPPKPGPVLPTPPKVKPPEPPPAPKPKPSAKPKPAPKPAAPALKQEHEAAFWAKHYAEKYGEAAPAVAWGRAMHERALDRPIGELAAQARKLADDGHPIFSDGMSIFSARAIERMATKLGPTATLRGSALIASEENRRAWVSVLSQIEHSRDVRRASFPIQAVNAEATKAKAFYETMLDASVQRPEGYSMHVGSRLKGANVETIERAYHNGFEKVVCVGKSETHEIYIHEWAHAIEATDKRALNRSFQFHEARTKGEAEKKLRDLFPKVDYEDHETAKPDEYWHAYQGKTYTLRSWDSVKEDWVHVRHNTEMTSMGYQAMSNRKEILEQDQETTWFMLGQLAGR